MADPFGNHRTAAMALITSGVALREREGQFLGGLAFRTDRISDKQENWLRVLLDKPGLPPLIGGDA